jgi:hypothetical protein
MADEMSYLKNSMEVLRRKRVIASEMELTVVSEG